MEEENSQLKPDVREEKKTYPKILDSRITLEPMWFGIFISVAMGIFSYKNLFLQRACLVDLNYSEDICFRSEGNNKTTIELESQKIVSSILVNSTFLSGFVICITFVFLGPWSDASGRRKPLIVLPIIGMMCSSMSMIVMQYFPTLSTTWVVYTELLPLVITGNVTLMVMSAYSYLGDICFKTGRCATTVMGSNGGFMMFSMVIGCAIGPFMYRNIGFTGMFTASFLLEASSLVYALYRIEDINVSKKCPNLFNFSLPMQAFKCVFKKRTGSKRKNILLMVIIPCTSTMIDSAEFSLNYLFLRNKFSWTEMEYGYYLVLKIGVQTFGTLLIVSLFKRKLNMKDQHIGILAGISQFISSTTFMLSPNPSFIYFSSMLILFCRGAMIVERPILNRQISANEQGKVNSVTTVLEKIVSFVFTPVANLIYSKTLYNFPASYTAICMVAAILQIICYSLVTDDAKLNENVENNDTCNTKKIVK